MAKAEERAEAKASSSRDHRGRERSRLPSSRSRTPRRRAGSAELLAASQEQALEEEEQEAQEEALMEKATENVRLVPAARCKAKAKTGGGRERDKAMKIEKG